MHRETPDENQKRASPNHSISRCLRGPVRRKQFSASGMGAGKLGVVGFSDQKHVRAEPGKDTNRREPLVTPFAKPERMKSPASGPKRSGESQRRESNPQPPLYESGALPIEATLASFGQSSALKAILIVFPAHHVNKAERGPGFKGGRPL